jgi:hypothetical protein
MNGFAFVSDPIGHNELAAGLAGGASRVDGYLRYRVSLRRPMGRRCGTDRDMETICRAQIALMVWRTADPRSKQWNDRFMPSELAT